MAFRKRIFIVAFLIAAIFVVDLVTPLGVAVWFLYAVPLLVFWETKNNAYLLAVCLLCSFLTLLVVYIRPAADRTAENLINRSIGILVAFIITFVLIARSRVLAQLKERNRELAEAYRKLEDEVTQRRQTEEELFASRERFLAMVECAAEGIYLITLDGTITYANPAFCALTGYGEKDLIGQKASALLNPGDDTRNESIWRHLRKGETWSGYVTSRKKDGTVFERHITVSPVKNSTGAITEYVAISRDVTREKRLEEQLRQSQKLEAIGTLAGGIAHDFNNIIAAIMGFTELSMEDIPRENPAQRHLSQIFKLVVRARDLVRQILTFSRQGDGQAGPIPFAPLVGDAMKLLRTSIPANIELRQDLTADDNLVFADPKDLQQIVIHLVTNAAQAMRTGGGTIDVDLRFFAAENAEPERPAAMKNRAYFKLTVRDTGPGIDVDTTRRLFDPFFTTKGTGGGKGMGLPLVYGIVSRLGGTVQVASTVGEGAVFAVYLPAAESQSMVGQNAFSEEDLYGTRVLFADDEEALAEVAGHALGRLGLKAVIMTDAEETLAAFNQSPHDFDLVILDQAMPKMTGVEVAKKMLTTRPDIPIILCTGFTEAVSEEEAKAMGIGALLMKPIVRDDLREAIRNVINSKRRP